METVETKFGKITPEQNAIREQVIKIAQEMGVNPELAEAVAWAESRFGKNIGPSSAGAIGIMQVDPKNTKGLGVTKESLNEPSSNIRVGLTLLNNSLERFGGNEILAVAGYNTRWDTGGKFAQSKNPADLPPATVAYLNEIDKYKPLMTKQGEAPPSTEKPPEAPPTQPPQQPPQPAVPNTKPPPDDMEARLEAAQAEQERRMGQLYGGGAGAAMSGSRLAGAGVKSGVSAIGEAFRGAPTAPPAAPAAPFAAQPTPPASGALQPRVGAPSAGGLPTPAGGSGTFNYGKAFGLTDIEAGKAIDMTKEAGGANDLMTQRRQNLQRIQQMFPGDNFVENPRYGGLMTQQQSVGLGPRAPYQGGAMSGEFRPPTAVGAGSPLPISTRPIPPRVSTLDSITNTIADMIGPASKTARVAGAFLKYASPPVALAQAGAEISDIGTELRKAELEKRKPDAGYLARRGIAATGDVFSAFPGGQSIGLPMAVGPSVYEYLRGREKEPAVEFEAGGLDPMGNPTQ